MLSFSNVEFRYDKQAVFTDLNLELDEGEFVFLIGKSGVGKSTLLQMIYMNLLPMGGYVRVNGYDSNTIKGKQLPSLRKKLGLIFQDFKLLPNKTVYENVSFALEVTGRAPGIVHTQVPQVLKLVGLSSKADRYPRQLSGGEQQRVSLARAFVNRPLILLADEPTGNLDPGTSVGIMRILDRINRTGTTVVMATHDHAIVDAMRRRVVALDEGKVTRDEESGRYEGLESGEEE